MSDIDFELDVNATLGLDDEDAKLIRTRQEWYKGEKGRTERVALVHFNNLRTVVTREVLRKNPEATLEDRRGAIARAKAVLAQKLGKSPNDLTAAEQLDTRDARFKFCNAAYHKDIGFVEVPHELSLKEQAVWRRLGDPRTHIYTLLLVYRGDRDGEVEPEFAARGWRVAPWRFSTGYLDVLRRIDKGLKESGSCVANYDLLLTCTDTQYQKLTITLAGAALYRKDPAFQRAVLEAAAAEGTRLKPFRQLTTDELREKLGLPAAEAEPGSDPYDIDLGAALTGT